MNLNLPLSLALPTLLRPNIRKNRKEKKLLNIISFWMNGSFTIIIIIVNINNRRMIKIIEEMDCKLTFFFSSLTSPETFNNKKCESIFLIEFLHWRMHSWHLLFILILLWWWLYGWAICIIRFATAMLPKLLQKIRRALIMSVLMILRPILMFISLIRNKIYITPLKKLNDASSLCSREVLKLILKSRFLYYIN